MKQLKIHIKGIVIKETVLGSDSKLINILTEKSGVISALACCGNNSKCKKMLSMQVFSYCNFTISKTNSGYIINEVYSIKNFCGVSRNIESLCIAQYLCEVALVITPEGRFFSDFFKLFLGCVFYISNQKKDLKLVKLIFEMRCCAMSGYLPDVLCCRFCQKYEHDTMYFLVDKGCIACKNCIDKHSKDFPLNAGMLFALRHILFSEIENLFSFNLSDNALDNLSALSEKYMIYHVCANFKSLKLLDGVSLNNIND